MHYITDADGRWINGQYETLALVIKDYEPTLELRFIPVGARETEEEKAEPYMIFDTLHNAPVMFFGDLVSPDEVLARLFLADSKYNDPIAILDAKNAAAKLLEQKAWMEKLEEATDIVASMVGSPLHTYRYNGKKFDHQRRVYE